MLLVVAATAVSCIALLFFLFDDEHDAGFIELVKGQTVKQKLQVHELLYVALQFQELVVGQ